mmetsp:Transcript_20315/g.50799  ORF Transcript_20315/g.50799 Transcript_20315/m.50799 type:complete len:204 (-) Transcript_20315:108-719(-)
MYPNSGIPALGGDRPPRLLAPSSSPSLALVCCVLLLRFVSRSSTSRGLGAMSWNLLTRDGGIEYGFRLGRVGARGAWLCSRCRQTSAPICAECCDREYHFSGITYAFSPASSPTCPNECGARTISREERARRPRAAADLEESGVGSERTDETAVWRCLALDATPPCASSPLLPCILASMLIAAVACLGSGARSARRGWAGPCM